jgi:hypothetical protein
MFAMLVPSIASRLYGSRMNTIPAPMVRDSVYPVTPRGLHGQSKFFVYLRA